MSPPGYAGLPGGVAVSRLCVYDWPAAALDLYARVTAIPADAPEEKRAHLARARLALALEVYRGD